MTAASAIASFSPALHIAFSETTTADTIDGTVPNLYQNLPVGETLNHVIADAEAEGFTDWLDQPVSPPCGGDVIGWVTNMSTGARDFRGPRGGYQWTADRLDHGPPDYDRVEAPDDITRVDLPFGLFTQPFTLLFMGGNFVAERMMLGVSTPVSGDPSVAAGPTAASVWYGGATACVGFETGFNGSWFGMGRNNNATDGALSVWVGNGLAYHGLGAITKQNWWGANGKGIHAVVYDPSRPVNEKLMVWADGRYGYVETVGDGDLQGCFNLLSGVVGKLMLYTGWDPAGVRRYVVPEGLDVELDRPEEGWPIETVYPWHTSGGGVLSNVALFGTAFTTGEMKDLFSAVNGGIDTSPAACSPWVGPGPVAIIDYEHLGDGEFVFDGSGSLAPDSTIASWSWEVSGPNPYNFVGSPTFGEVFSTDEITDPVTLVRSEVYGSYVEIQLTVVNADGQTNSATVRVLPPDDGEPGIDHDWHVGMIGW